MSKSGGPQKVDHGGNFIMLPRRLLSSVAFRSLSDRATRALLVLHSRFNGYNNGEIGLGVHELAHQMGNKNYGAAGRALAALIDRGIVECVCDFDFGDRRARTFRLSYISTGKAGRGFPATHDYEDWRPGPDMPRRKFGGAKLSLNQEVSGAAHAPTLKVSGAMTSPGATENCRVQEGAGVAGSALLIMNHSPPPFMQPEPVPTDALGIKAAVTQTQLRHWVKAVVEREGFGAQRRLASAAKVPEPSLSRFIAGRKLAPRHVLGLQHACARVIPFKDLGSVIESYDG